MKQIMLALFALLHLWPAHAQKLGIGITNPKRAILEVNGAVGATSAIFGGDGTGISFMRNWPTVGFNYYYNGSGRYMVNGYAASQLLDPNAGYMAFDMYETGTANKVVTTSRRILTISGTGQFWIGSNPHNTSISVPHPFGILSTAYFLGTTYHSTFNYGANEDTYLRAGKDGGSVVINDIPGGKIIMSGYVGINTTTPQYPMDLYTKTSGTRSLGLTLVDPNGFNYWQESIPTTSPDLYLSSNNQGMGFFDASDGDWSSPSDRRLKTGIQPLAPMLQQLSKMRPVSYVMKPGKDSKRVIGFLAQEVRTLFPDMVDVVTTGSKGYEGINDLHTLNYTAFYTIAIKSIQEQQKMIVQQHEELVKLESEYEFLLQEAKQKLQPRN